MKQEDIEINSILYWNTTGAYNTNISLRCKVIDIGRVYIWIHVFGNLGPTPVSVNKLSKVPLYKVTNKNIKGE